ncbi:hypothetical protein [Streptomyces sp. NBC_01465]|uniref:hypothetical protein n=1 Tax=Streptomyces sp. NBC_01465 TaxID=2903878 RepID=UPI002E379CBE|nr:hypothetical protein [Streptomyces sp. NBC_01465]
MGFWGYYVVGRSDGPLDALGALADVRDGLALHEERDGGWQVWRRPSEPEVGDMGALARGVAKETGLPALFAFVMGGECVVVEAAAPVGGSWFACLGREAMARYLGADGLVLEDLFLGAREATARAVEWAGEAGLVAQERALADVLHAQQGPSAEELLDRFLDRLGLARL